MHNVTVKYVKKNGQLEPATPKDAGSLKLFNMSIKEGEQVEMYLTVIAPGDKTMGQLAKAHAMIRELANFTGHTFDEIKDEVKRKTGLYVITGPASSDKKFKSFADCSKDELSKVIETCIEIGHMLGYNIY